MKNTNLNLAIFGLLALAGLFGAGNVSAYSISFWTRSDRCEGPANGEIIILSDASGNAICKKVTTDSNVSSSTSLWSVAVNGICDKIVK